jgi:hypothetical protein
MKSRTLKAWAPKTCVPWTLAALIALAGSCLPGAARAQQPASPFAPVETPTLNPDALKTPEQPKAEVDRSKFDKSNKDKPPLKLPNSVDLGKYELKFDANKTSNVNPRTGLDSGETSNLSKMGPGRKDESALPNYFGLKLTAPTH